MLLESLVARCIDAGEDYRDQLERQCADHPEAAATLRARIEQLEKLGFLGAPSSGQESSWLPDRVGRYHLTDLLGRGGMGLVFRGRAAGSDTDVAVKLVRPDLLSDLRARERFRREALLAARLAHPGICPVLEVGIHDDLPFLVMPLLQGRTLRARLQEPGVDRTTVLGHIEAAAQALHAAHEAGLVHRDVSPNNLFVTDDGRAVLFDFGLARDLTGEIGTLTASHEQLGTLPYMAPEQLTAAAKVDRRADVYSLGAVLYHALAGRPPFESQHRSELSRMILAGESPRLRRLVRDLPRGLDLVVHKAIDVEPGQRYATAAEFAADLRRCREGGTVLARGLGFGVRTRRWVRHHPVATTALSLLSAILVMTGVMLRNEELAKEEAQRIAGLLANKVREFDLLAGVVMHARAVANEKDLYPAWPHKVEAMVRWLEEDAGKLLAKQPEIERTMRDLRARALPATLEDLEKDRRSHPRFAEFQLLGKRVAALRYSQAIRAGITTLVVPELTTQQEALDVQALNTRAWDRVAPTSDERKVYGEEALGLAYARAAAAMASGTQAAFQIQDSLAWALVANGQDAAAKEASELALRLAPAAKAAEYEQQYLRNVQTAIEKATETLADAGKELAAITTLVDERRTFRFELESQQFLHDTLADLTGKISSLAHKEKAAVEQRLAWGKHIQGLSLMHPNSRHTWTAVRAAIAGNTNYAGQQIELRDQDITGLVPIGENPVTHLWEFYELRSAWDGEQDPRTIVIPRHETDGSIQVTAETGIVFVLVPGGTFTMGAQKDDPNGPNHDPQATGNESPPHEILLAPFFLARHELTRGQWQRLMATVPFWWKDGGKYDDDIVAIGPTHPAESVDWEDANGCMQQHGLCLPTEAQWEYGCRAGQSTPWWTGADAVSLAGAANLKDQTATRHHPEWGMPEPFDDGFTAPTRVGSYRANALGLFDIHGNVWEWCRDWYGSYEAPWQVGDGLRFAGSSAGERCFRGGCHSDPAAHARSACRIRTPPSSVGYHLGLRPARSLQPGF